MAAAGATDSNLRPDASARTDASGPSRWRRWPGYRTVWRWHFYAGLFCIPFVLWLSVTGTIYLFKPQIDAWLDRPFEHLDVEGPAASAAAQISAALAAVPGARLNAYELPRTPRSAARVLLDRGGNLVRVYVHPRSTAVLRVIDEDARFTRQIFHLHGELMLGDRGSMLIELAASWIIVMLLTGLFLWWPRSGGLAGIVYPRFGRGQRTFWRDLHAVTGFWVSLLALFLLVSGLPWAKSWGSLLKQVRQLSSETVVRQDWPTGATSERKERIADAAANTDHARHGGHGGSVSAAAPVLLDEVAIERMLASVRALDLAPPVLLAPPTGREPHWTARSDAQDRPLRVNLVLDADSGAVLERSDFADRPLLDRIIGVGVAAHEGQLFGWFNQALGVFTTSGLVLVSISATVLWWRRRQPGTLGAPAALASATTLPIAFFAIVAGLGILLPLLGLSMLGLGAIEFGVLRRIAPVRAFLGLGT